MSVSHPTSVASVIESLAEKIVVRRLDVPAILALEMHLPLTNIFHNTTLFVEPVVAPLLGMERFANIQQLLSDRANIEALIERIRTLSEDRE